MGYKLTATNLQNVGPGNTATLKLNAGPGSPTYDQIKLELSQGMTPAHIEWVRGKANGRIFFDDLSGTVLNAREAYRGIFADASNVVLDFTEPKARNGAAEQLLAAVPGALLNELIFEVKIAAGAPALGRIRAIQNYRPPTNNSWILKRLNTTQAFSSAGTDAAPNIMYLPTGGSGGKIKRIWLHESVAGVITGTAIRIANNSVFEATRAQVEHDQKRFGLVPQAGVHVLDFVEDGNLQGWLDTSRAPAVELRLTMSAAAQVQVFYDLVDPIGRL